MTRPEVLRRRLSRLGEYLDILKRLAAYPLEEFLASPERYGAAERFLQLSLEAINDMAAHVAAEEGWGPFERARDLVDLFLARGLVEEELAERWRRMIGFRNLLVHDYLDVDRKLVHRFLREGLQDLEALARVFARLL
jgi:uncharacterized protein YutE (UPF0331/DUF86 family)